MNTQELALPETNKNGMAAVEQANAIVIITNNDFLAADAFAVGLKKLEKEVDLAYDEHITAAHSAHKALVQKKKKYAEPIIEARNIIKTKLAKYQDEQEAIRQVEEAKQREAARKQAEESALQAAIEAEAQGDKEAASAIIEAPVDVPAIMVPKSTPKASTVIQTRWSAQVENEYFVRDAIAMAGKALAKWPNDPAAVTAKDLLARAFTSVQYMCFDQVKLNKQAVATKDSVVVDGVKFFSKRV